MRFVDGLSIGLILKSVLEQPQPKIEETRTIFICCRTDLKCGGKGRECPLLIAASCEKAKTKKATLTPKEEPQIPEMASSADSWPPVSALAYNVRPFIGQWRGPAAPAPALRAGAPFVLASSALSSFASPICRCIVQAARTSQGHWSSAAAASSSTDLRVADCSTPTYSCRGLKSSKRK
jgi:hypothetical protein